MIKLLTYNKKNCLKHSFMEIKIIFMNLIMIVYREKFINKVAQLSLTAVFYLTSANFIFYKFMRGHSTFGFSGKVASFGLINTVPLIYFLYDGMKAYNRANEFLYQKYLLKAK